MLVTERMQALGDHARSSRQPPVKERRYPGAGESAAKDDDVVANDAPENAAQESAAAPIADEATTVSGAQAAPAQPPAHENTDNDTAEPQAARDDTDLEAAKRAIIHEWENWSALHSDELGDPNVAEYFFRHLQIKKIPVLNSCSSADQTLIESWFRETVGTECVSR